jgi:hypothetical protein
VTPRLFHFTCADHGFSGIGSRGLIVPRQGRTLFGVSHLDWGVVWLTSGDHDATGMGKSGFEVCDRSEYRYVVTDTSTCERWLDSRVRKEADVMEGLIDLLEMTGDASTWWISKEPVPARLA